MNASHHPGPRPRAWTTGPARLAVGVVGTGRVGSALGAALRPGRPPGGRRLRRLRRAPGAAPPRCCPASRWSTPRRGAGRAPTCAAHRPDDALPALVAGLADDRRGRARARLLAHTSGRHGVGVLDPAAARRRAAAGAAPGDDLHRHRRGRRPAGRLLASGSPRPTSCGRSPRPWSSRWAASRSGSPRRPARSTTRPSPSARTTWSPWSRRPRELLGRGRASASPAGCSARCSAPPSTTRCAPATPRSPARSPAATPAPCAAHLASSRAPAPRTTAARLPRAGPAHRRPRPGGRPARAGGRRGAARRTRRRRAEDRTAR